MAKVANSESLRVLATVGCSRILLRGDTLGTQGVSLALDEDVQFSRRPLGASTEGDALDFPYGVLEVASEHDEKGDWLQEVQSFAALRHTAGFSVGTQAIASLHAGEVPEKPHWFQFVTAMEVAANDQAWSQTAEFRRAVSEAKDAEVSRERLASLVEEQSSPRSSRPAAFPAFPPMPAAVEEEDEGPPIRILPKNFLASERTFLEWAHTCIALGFLGLALWRVSLQEDGPDSPKPFLGIVSMENSRKLFLSCYSLLLVAIAVGFAWYATWAHVRRNNSLFADADAHKERVFNSRYAPTCFAVTVGAALLVHMVVQVAPSFFGIGFSGTGASSLPVLLAAR